MRIVTDFSVTSRPLRVGAGTGFVPDSIFSADDVGAWFDPSDTSTLFADTEGTLPAQTGHPVALMLDKSGNGNHAAQPTFASRPMLRQDAQGRFCLEFNGINQRMRTPQINAIGTNKLQAFLGACKLTNSVGYPLNVNDTDDPGWSLRLPRVSTGSGIDRFAMRLNDVLSAEHNGNPAPFSGVYTGLGDGDGSPKAVLRINGVQRATAGGSTSGNFGNDRLFIGSRSTSATHFEGYIYGVLVRYGPPLPMDTIAKVERYIAKRTGVALP